MKIVYLDETPSLAHHGIKGQKWGVRRFQNYDGSYTAAGRARYLVGNQVAVRTTIPTRNDDYDHSTHTSNFGKTALATAGLLITSGMYSGYRVAGPNGALYGAAIGTLGSAVAIGAMAVKQHLGTVNEKKILNANKESGVVDPKTGFYKKADREYTEEEDVKAVNPGFKKYTDDTHNNCVLCSLAYNLRQDGYAVSANYASYGYQSEDVSRWFKNTKLVSHEEAKDAFDPRRTHYDKKFREAQNKMIDQTRTEIESEGPGARGYFSTGYFIPDRSDIGVYHYGGHAMAYKVNSDGKVDIIDAQEGKVYKDALNHKNTCPVIKYSLTMDHIRLDNTKVNAKTIQEVAHS